MQGNDFVQSVMYTRGVTCFSCHDVHGTGNNADLLKPANDVCLTCHGPKSPNGPHAATIEQHTHHQAGSRATNASAATCRRSQQTIADVNVRSHTFKFIPPVDDRHAEGAEPLHGCHTDKTNEWARKALASWPEFSRWRVGQ